MKKLFVIIILFASIILVGCAKTDLTLDIDKDGNTKMSMKFISKQSGSLSQDELLEIKEKYGADNIKKISEGDYNGYIISKSLGNIKDEVIYNNAKKNNLIKLKKNKSFLYTTYDVNFNIKDEIKNNMSKEDSMMMNLIGNTATLNFHIISPLKFIDSNATSSSKNQDGRITYNWEYSLYSVKNIHIKFKIMNYINVAFVIIIILILLAIIYKYRKKKKRNIYTY
ncbi:hypothetical protein H9L25_04850 [Terrisporobacter mayombei]|nr:hypothetical protein [Terrisporobacter mayombei]